jgi:hypothetical protein
VGPRAANTGPVAIGSVKTGRPHGARYPSLRLFDAIERSNE